MKFLTGLCQDDVTTSSGDVISKIKLHIHVPDKFFGKVTGGISKIYYGSGVMQQKVGLRVNLPPLRVNLPPLGSICGKQKQGTANLTVFVESPNSEHRSLLSEVFLLFSLKSRLFQESRIN